MFNAIHFINFIYKIRYYLIQFIQNWMK